MKNVKFAKKEMIIAIIVTMLLFIFVSLLELSKRLNLMFSIMLVISAVSVKVIAFMITYKNNADKQPKVLRAIFEFLRHKWFDVMLMGVCLGVITIRLTLHKDYVAAVLLRILVLCMGVKVAMEYRREKYDG